MKKQRGCQVGIQPIDLQTLYSQLEKVGKIQGEHQHALANQLEKQQEANKAESLQRLVTVQKTAADDSESTVINSDGKNNSQTPQQEQREKQKKQPDMLEKKKNYINDPHLGRKIDVSG